MKRTNLYTRLWSRRWALVLAGTITPLSLSGCDPTIRDTLLTGIQTSASTLLTSVLEAFFTALQNVATSQTAMSTVEAVKTFVA